MQSEDIKTGALTGTAIFAIGTLTGVASISGWIPNPMPDFSIILQLGGLGIANLLTLIHIADILEE